MSSFKPSLHISSHIRLGLDIGGTKFEIMALDELGSPAYRHRVPTPTLAEHRTHEYQYQAFIRTIHDLIHHTINRFPQPAPTFSVGLGTPGALDHEGLMKNANSVCLNGRPFLRDLQKALQRLGIDKVAMANDANCFALSEATDGAGLINGHQANAVFGVILGTGVGGGIVFRGALHNGINAIAGEWGHNPLPWADEEEINFSTMCYCSRRGCIETWLSGPALSADLARNSGINLNAQEITAIAQQSHHQNHAPCHQALIRYERRLAKALASVINVLDPEVIVLGGGLSQINRLYTEVPQYWPDYVFSNRVQTQLRPPQHGDSSGVRGAAWLIS